MRLLLVTGMAKWCGVRTEDARYQR